LGGPSSTSEAEQVEHLQEQSATIDRTNAGVATTSASPVTNDNYASGTMTSSYDNMSGGIPTTSGGIPVLTVTPSGSGGIGYQSVIDTLGYEYSNYLAYTYEAFTYTNIGGVVDVAYQYYNGEIGGWSAGAQLGMAALFGGAGVKAYRGATKLVTHLNYLQEYGASGYRSLQNGRIRYYGGLQSASRPGRTMGSRYVHEYNPSTGQSRGWHERVNHNGDVIQVRPELTNRHIHYEFDDLGNYTGAW